MLVVSDYTRLSRSGVCVVGEVAFCTCFCQGFFVLADINNNSENFLSDVQAGEAMNGGHLSGN